MAQLAQLAQTSQTAQYRQTINFNASRVAPFCPVPGSFPERYRQSNKFEES